MDEVCRFQHMTDRDLVRPPHPSGMPRVFDDDEKHRLYFYHICTATGVFVSRTNPEAYSRRARGFVVQSKDVRNIFCMKTGSAEKSTTLIIIFKPCCSSFGVDTTIHDTGCIILVRFYLWLHELKTENRTDTQWFKGAWHYSGEVMVW